MSKPKKARAPYACPKCGDVDNIQLIEHGYDLYCVACDRFLLGRNKMEKRKSAGSLHRTITINVAYDPVSIDDTDELDRALEREVERCISDGLLSPNGEYVVETWECDVR